MSQPFSRGRLLLLGLLLALLGAGVWAYHGASQSLRDLRGTGLRTLLNTQSGTLDQWIAERRHEGERLATNPRLRPELEVLVRSRGSKPGGFIDAALERARAIGITHLRLIATDGRILAGNGDASARNRADAYFLGRIAEALKGRAVFIRPATPGGTGAEGLIWIAVPVRSGSRVLAVLALGSDPAGDFARMFAAARLGRSGDAIAFDADGWLLSPSRHDEELRARGQLPRLALPDSEGGTPTALARAAAAARATGGEGLLLQAYPNLLGREVIGAWRWRDDLDLGIAVEIEADEAYAPLIYLQIGFAVVLLLLFLVWLSGFLTPNALAGLLRRDGLRQLGPYTLIRQIGEGAISNVYLARHRMLKRPAAVKVLKRQSTSDEWTDRFRREVQLCSQLEHPNTISIHDYGNGPGGELWYAMEYLEGLSLHDLVERYGPVPPPRTAYILRQACASLWEAHSCGLVHRDIKPQNLMICDQHGERDFVKVLDFGLVKQIDGDETRELTANMRLLGTPLYMSPERIRHPADADGRADIYALGAVGFYLLTGKRLFETETEHDLTYHVLHVAPRLASECSPFAVPAELDALIGRCLEKEVAGRPQTIAEMASALDSILVQTPWTRSQIEAWWKRHWTAETEPGRRYRAG